MFFSTLTYCYSAKIDDYSKIFLPIFDAQGDLQVAIRFFKKDKISSFLVVNPISLKTKILNVNDISLKNPSRSKKPSSNQYAFLIKTPYFRELSLDRTHIVHGHTMGQSAILTVDLCPSTKKFEKNFFDTLEQYKKPFPIAISISGLWILKHPDEFGYLIDLQSQGKLAITWVNHGFTHLYYSDKAIKENFLLSPQVDFENEILLTEKLLLEANQTPSVFFRFPGLIDNEQRIKQLKEYGLLALGADAWLGKDQEIQEGSIVLIHGNGNEPLGIKRLYPQLKNWNWMSLPEHI